MQVVIVDQWGGIGLGAADQLIETDLQDVGDANQHVEVRRIAAALPAVVAAWRHAEQLGQPDLGKSAQFTELA